jgi:hypothetical protein
MCVVCIDDATTAVPEKGERLTHKREKWTKELMFFFHRLFFFGTLYFTRKT